MYTYIGLYWIILNYLIILGYIGIYSVKSPVLLVEHPAGAFFSVKSPVLLVERPAGAFSWCEKPGVAGLTALRGFFFGEKYHATTNYVILNGF